MQLADEEAGIKIVETAHERGRPLDFDLPSIQGRSREMATVVRHDQIGVRANGRKKRKPIKMQARKASNYRPIPRFLLAFPIS